MPQVKYNRNAPYKDTTHYQVDAKTDIIAPYGFDLDTHVQKYFCVLARTDGFSDLHAQEDSCTLITRAGADGQVVNVMKTATSVWPYYPSTIFFPDPAAKVRTNQYGTLLVTQQFFTDNALDPALYSQDVKWPSKLGIPYHLFAQLTRSAAFRAFLTAMKMTEGDRQEWSRLVPGLFPKVAPLTTARKGGRPGKRPQRRGRGPRP